jgi:predicted phosphodiesterase
MHWKNFGRFPKPFALIAALVWLSFSPVLAADRRSLITKGPYIQSPTADTMVVMWESLTNTPGIVRFGLRGKLDFQVGNIQPRVMKGRTSGSTNQMTAASAPEAFYIYEAALKDLKPGRSYAYSVEFGGVRSAVHHFKTFTPDADKVRFIAYGDTRSDPQVHAELASRFRKQRPDFILHSGDLVAKGRDYGLWAKEFFTPMASVISEVPFFSVIGNHEEDGTNYLGYFHLPGQELWYSVDIGPVHVLALDFHFENSRNEQFQFASKDLATSRAPWKIVILHTPMFNIGGHVSSWGKTNYLPLFFRTKVDLVLAGHSHMYERFRPVAPRDEHDWAITHVTTGGGGANLHPSFDHPALRVRETTNHFMVFDVTRNKLRAKTIRANGTLLDSFELRKKDGRIPPEYLAQVYPEEALRLFYDAVPSLASRAASLPRMNQSARVMLNLTPGKTSSEPMELEITLAPESAPYYVLEDGPLRAVTPAAGQTNSVLWTKIRASGKKEISSNKSDELVPPLVLMAKVRSGGDDTISYGARCRLSKAAAEAARK